MTRVLDPQRLSTGRVLAASTALLTLAVVLGGALLADVSQPPFREVDDGWAHFMGTLHSPFWDGVNSLLNIAGYRGVLLGHGLLALALLVRKRPQAAIFAAAAGIAVLILTQVSKAAILRERPANTIVLTDTGSFPSGHVTSTTAFVLVLALLVGRVWVWVLAAVGIAAMMLSRTYLSAHWLMDTVGGVCLAAPVVLIVWLFY
jgi:membrane-associated phospholipid phosphatase